MPDCRLQLILVMLNKFPLVFCQDSEIKASGKTSFPLRSLTNALFPRRRSVRSWESETHPHPLSSKRIKSLKASESEPTRHMNYTHTQTHIPARADLLETNRIDVCINQVNTSSEQILFLAGIRSFFTVKVK